MRVSVLVNGNRDLKLCKPPVGLLKGLESRSKQPEYAQLLLDCQRMYCEIRLQLMAGVIQSQIAQHTRDPLPAQTRSGWAILMQASSTLSAAS